MKRGDTMEYITAESLAEFREDTNLSVDEVSTALNISKRYVCTILYPKGNTRRFMGFKLIYNIKRLCKRKGLDYKKYIKVE